MPTAASALVGQYRYPHQAYSWEIPEGGCPVGTDPLATARRELKEETGLEADFCVPVQELDLSNSVSDESAILYLAWGLHAGQAVPEETERLVVRWLPFAEAAAMAKDGRIRDSMSVAALLRVALMRAEG